MLGLNERVILPLSSCLGGMGKSSIVGDRALSERVGVNDFLRRESILAVEGTNEREEVREEVVRDEVGAKIEEVT